MADTNKISLIATLFTSQTPPRRLSTGNNPFETDFMFALFIQQQEGGQTKDSNVTKANAPPPIPRPDPDDPEVGHFCAPFCPGFCEANFCIFHAPIKGSIAQNGQK
jgi:hypothetical protein